MSLAGGNIAARRAAVYEAAASLLSLEDVRITVAGEVAQNYIGTRACVREVRRCRTDAQKLLGGRSDCAVAL